MIYSGKSEPAVTPVIGTILLVAIAVVLVAIILVVVMGFSGDTNEKKVGLNAKSESGANATLILYGGASIDELVKLEMIDQGSSNASYVELWDINDGDAFVGVPYLAEGVAQPEESMAVYDTRINVRGTFRDGTKVILLVQPMTFYDVTGLRDLLYQSMTPPTWTKSLTSYPETNHNKTITVTYKNAPEIPTAGYICYQRTGEDVVRIEMGAQTATTGTMAADVVLEAGTYKFWGEIVCNGFTYECPVATYAYEFVVQNTYVNMGYWIFNPDIPGEVTVTYDTIWLPSTPTAGYLCYQPDGGLVTKIAPLVLGTRVHEVLTLEVGVTYTVWIEVVLVDTVTIVSNLQRFKAR